MGETLTLQQWLWLNRQALLVSASRFIMADRCAQAMVRYQRMLEAVRDGHAPYSCIREGRYVQEAYS